MKRALSLILLLPSLTHAATQTYFLPGVSEESGWYDVSKHNVTFNGPDDSQMCASVAASNMMAYWLDSHKDENGQWVETKWGSSAEEIYENIYKANGNQPYLIWQVLNTLTDTDLAARPAAAYFDTRLTNKVDITPDGGFTGSLYSMMKLEDAFEWGISNGAPMGLSIMNMGSGAAHALTVWGIGYEVYTYGDRSSRELRYLYYTNSDNGYKLQKGLLGAEPEPVGDTFATSYTLTYQEGDDTRSWRIASVDFLLDPFAIPSKVDVKDDHKYTLSGGQSGELFTGGAHADATSFDMEANSNIRIGGGMVLDSQRLRSENDSTATLSGTGTYVAHDFNLGKAKLGDDWRGTVQLTGYAKNLTAQSINNMSLQSSMVELKGASTGDLEGGSVTITANITLTNGAIDSDEAGLQLRALYGDKTMAFNGIVSGSGDLMLGNWDRDETNARISCSFSNDVSRWNGSFVSKIKNGGSMDVSFATGGIVSADIVNAEEGNLRVHLGKNTIMNGNISATGKGSVEVSAENGVSIIGSVAADTMQLNGKVFLAGQEAPAPATGPENRQAGMPSLKLAAAVDEKATAPKPMKIVFGKGSQLVVNGDYDTTNLSITLSEDYVKALGNHTAKLISARDNTAGWEQLLKAPDGFTLKQDGEGNIFLVGTEEDLDLEVGFAGLEGNVLTLTPAGQDISELSLQNLANINVHLSDEAIAALAESEADLSKNVWVNIGGNTRLGNLTFLKAGAAAYGGDNQGQYSLATLTGKSGNGTVPEPATGTLSLFSLAGLMARRRRK